MSHRSVTIRRKFLRVCTRASPASFAQTNMPNSGSVARSTARLASTWTRPSIGAPCGFSAAERLGITSQWNRRFGMPVSSLTKSLTKRQESSWGPADLPHGRVRPGQPRAPARPALGAGGPRAHGHGLQRRHLVRPARPAVQDLVHGRAHRRDVLRFQAQSGRRPTDPLVVADSWRARVKKHFTLLNIEEEVARD